MQEKSSEGRRPLQLGRDIADRLLEFGSAALWIIQQLPRSPAARHVGMQLFEAATSGGSNYEEARAAESRADFVHKLGVAAKEIREAGYWIRLVHRSGWTHADLRPLVGEAGELAAILAASARTARARRDADR